jgi:hypothetical protein
VIYYKTCNEFGWGIAAAAVEEIVATQNFTRKKLVAAAKKGFQKLMLRCQIFSVVADLQQIARAPCCMLLKYSFHTTRVVFPIVELPSATAGRCKRKLITT